MPPGIHPSKAQITCANCGYEYTNNHANIHPNQKIPVDCKECPSGGTVLHNQYGYISGTYGAVTARPPEDDS